MIDFKDLDTDSKTAPTKGLTEAQMRERASIVNGGEAGYEQITCKVCGGRGSRTYGYVNIRTYPCKICHETGKVTAKRLANIERAKKASATAEQNKRERRQEFQQANEALISGLAKASEWSSFAASLMESFNERGSLSEKQIAAGQSMLDKLAAKAKEKAVARNEKSGELNASAIHALFDTAQANGLKRPKFIAGEIKISLAPATGRNAGSLYVVRGEEYQGKIFGGVYQAVNAASADTLAVLIELAKNPSEAARMYGKQTGVCCCCGRELTDPVSIAAGIGPICANKWGL